MEKTKVVVMGAKEVAAMRNAHKEAEAAYFDAKVGALEFIAEEMRTTGQEYTAAELSSMCGLTSGEIAAQMSGWCRAAEQAGINRFEVDTYTRFNEMQFVRVMPNGSINPDQCIKVTRRQTTYKIDGNKSKRK